MARVKIRRSPKSRLGKFWFPAPRLEHHTDPELYVRQFERLNHLIPVPVKWGNTK